MGDVQCTSLLRVVVSEMTYTVSNGTLNPTIPYHYVMLHISGACLTSALPGLTPLLVKQKPEDLLLLLLVLVCAVS